MRTQRSPSRLLLVVPLLLACGAEPRPAPEGAEVVVLLHGLGRSDQAMDALEERLAAAGYRVENLDYPSTELGPDALDDFLHERLLACCADAGRVHFVTHSLGGILTRAYLAEHPMPNLGRVVMLAPPNQGSEFVDLLGETTLFRWALGPTAVQLGTGPDSLPNRLPPPDYELGVIAGTRSVNPLGPLVVPGESDGTVSLESARVEGMTDFVAIPATHTFIMHSDEAAEQVLAFLRTGRFRHAGDAR